MTAAEALLRRVNAMTSVLALIAVVAFSGLLYALDARENQRNAAALRVLSLVQDVPPADDLLGDPEALGPGVAAWLDDPAQANLDEQRRAARQKLVDWLHDLHDRGTLQLAGGPAALNRLAGKPGRERAHGERTAIPFRLYTLALGEPDDSPPDDRRVGAQLPSVAAAIRRLRRLGRPTEIRVATAVSPQAPSGVRAGPWRLAGIALADGTVAIRLDAGPQAQTAQQTVPTAEVRVPATATAREAPSPLQLYLEPRDAEALRALSGLLDRAARLDRLAERYGLLPVAEAQTAAGRAVARSFDAVDVLGFSFSPQRFPLAIVVLGALVQAGILASLENARRRGVSFRGAASDSAVQVLTERLTGRVLLWIGLPLLSVGAALPAAHLSPGESLAIAGGATLVGLLGSLCVVRSRTLF